MTITNLTAIPKNFNTGLNNVKKNQNPSFKSVYKRPNLNTTFVLSNKTGSVIAAVRPSSGNSSNEFVDIIIPGIETPFVDKGDEHKIALELNDGFNFHKE